MSNEKIKVVLVDDHVLLRNALATLIDSFDTCSTIHQCDNGNKLISFMRNHQLPDVILLDLNMPMMNGFETAEWLKKNYPDIPVLMLTMYDSELSLIRLLQYGVKGFLKKDIHPDELRFALETVSETGYYFPNQLTNTLVNLFEKKDDNTSKVEKSMFNEEELIFLELSCTELTYKEIALQMDLTPRKTETLREILFTKLGVKTRVGLVMISIRNGIVIK